MNDKNPNINVDREKSRELKERGVQLVDEGNVAEAISVFKELSNRMLKMLRPAFTLDIATCQKQNISGPFVVSIRPSSLIPIM